ncbi:uncharacterized protein LOC142996523 isoform X2 [Genypterus blacodes]|uniref:uncharacterized protein LOC142996523 isoform X2 n=1 Tax=Genypterus blacodes TaxID=154954 RepID=UPI003F765ADC
MATMSRNQSKLEGRLDDMLSRIATETQEIRELEQQLTDGQILVNEALQRDLEGIICGLQKYLRGLREQAQWAQQQAQSVQVENRTLQRHLEDTQRHCRQLEDTNRTRTLEVHVQQEELSVLRKEAEALRDRQAVQSSRQQSELRELREELNHQLTLGQDENSSLLQIVHHLQSQFEQTRSSMLDPQEVHNRLKQLVEALNTEEETFRYLLPSKHCQTEKTRSPIGPQDLLSTNLKQLYREIQQIRTTRDQVLLAHDQIQEQIAQLEAQLAQRQIAHLQAQLSLKQEQQRSQQLRDDLEPLRDKLQRTEELQRQTQTTREAEVEQSRLQLQEVQEERDAMLVQLRSERDGHQEDLARLHRKLRRLSRSMSQTRRRTGEQRERGENVVNEQDGSLLKEERTKARLHTHRLREQPDRTRTGSKDGGQRCNLQPGYNAPSLGSQGTQDSGLGLQYLGSPVRGRHQDILHAGGGCWVFMPLNHMDSETGAECRDSGGDSDGSRSSRGGAPPAPSGPAAGLSAGPAWLLCGPPAAAFYGAPAGGAVLHCNIPEHRDVTEGCVCEADRLEEEKKKRQETRRLRHRSVLLVCDEVECVEKTLLKRRAELRQADRLLLEAQSCIHTARDKVEQLELRLVHKRQEEHRLSQRLQGVKEELSRWKEERSSLQEQCKHLEARRRHADGCLSALEAELTKKRDALGYAHLLRRGQRYNSQSGAA